MELFKKLFKKQDVSDWKVTHRGMLKDITYDEIVSVLGRPTKAKGDFVFWRGPITDLDEDLPEGYYQLSNKDFRTFGDVVNKPSLTRTSWFVLASSPTAIKLLANELGALVRNVESI